MAQRITDSEQQTLDKLLCLAAYDGLADTCKFLLDNGANANTGNGAALVHAVATNNHSVASVLLEAGPDVNSCVAADGSKLMEVAAFKGDWDMCRYLLENCKIELGEALHIAAREGFTDLCRLLVEHGAAVNAHERFDGDTPLHLAAKHGNTDTCEALIEMKADLESRNDTQDTPLTYAVYYGYYSTVKLLLSRGARTDAVDADGKTALHLCAEASRDDLCKLLLAYKADAYAKDSKGRTPLGVSRSAIEGERLQPLLEEAMAKTMPKASRKEPATKHDSQVTFTCSGRVGLKPEVMQLLESNEHTVQFTWCDPEGTDSLRLRAMPVTGFAININIKKAND